MSDKMTTDAFVDRLMQRVDIHRHKIKRCNVVIVTEEDFGELLARFGTAARKERDYDALTTRLAAAEGENERLRRIETAMRRWVHTHTRTDVGEMAHAYDEIMDALRATPQPESVRVEPEPESESEVIPATDGELAYWAARNRRIADERRRKREAATPQPEGE